MNYNEQFPAFVPVGEELVQLAKYWLREELSVMWFLNHSVGRSEVNRRDHVRQRVYGELAPLLGDGRVEKLGIEVLQEFCAEWRPDERRVFISGNGDDRERLIAQMVDEEVWLMDSEEVAQQIIATGSREDPVSSKVLEERLGCTEDQVWQVVRHLLRSGRIICFDLTELSAPASERGSLGYWCPETEAEREAWMEEAALDLARAKQTYESVVAARNRDADSAGKPKHLTNWSGSKPAGTAGQ